MGYTRDAIKGLSWMGVSRIVIRILSFVKISVLARVLNPAQFGIFGIASIVLAFLEIVTETGINVYLIQANDNINKYISSAWIVSILRGVIISLFIILSSPFISSFFHTPEAKSILYFISVVPFIRGFINPSEIKFQKELNFNYEFRFRSILFFFEALVSVILSLSTHSVYSLVWGLVASASLEVLLSFILIKPIPKLDFHKEYIWEIIHKGKWVTAYGIFDYITQEIDTVFVGRFVGASSLGIYQMAYNISILPISEITDVVGTVVFPIYAKIGEDRQRLKIAFRKCMLFTVPVTIALGATIFFFPKEIILIVLGNKWTAAADVLRLLAVYGALRAIFGSVNSLFLGISKQNYVTITNLARAIILIIAMPFFVSNFGMIGAAYALILSVLVEAPFTIYLLLKVFKKLY